jgi:serine/threonine-protein kinase HipA
MKRTINVYLGEAPKHIGVLRYNQEGARESASFEYETAWLIDPQRFAIDPLLPLQAGAQYRKRSEGGSIFHSAIADTEPDGWGKTVIRRDHAKRRAAAKAAGQALPPIEGALDFLLGVDDPSRIGALRFQDESGVFQRTIAPGQRSVPPQVELQHLIAATSAVELHQETAEDLAYLRGRGTSLGGLRPKATIVDHAGRLAIGKFPSVRDERAVTKGEVLALHLATRAGMDAAHANLVMSEDVPVAVVRRFDRDEHGSRFMYVSAATMLGVEAQGADQYTYTDIVDTIRQHGAKAQHDIDELWRRIAFSILINNVDDHLHNHGFLHAESGKWRLSPAFDVNPFPDRARELKTWITADTGPAATIDALLSATKYFAIQPSRAQDILKEVERAVSQWEIVGRELGMSEIDLAQFADAFEHPQREAARKALAMR